jgi:hypothetical protein
MSNIDVNKPADIAKNLWGVAYKLQRPRIARAAVGAWFPYRRR